MLPVDMSLICKQTLVGCFIDRNEFLDGERTPQFGRDLGGGDR